MQDQSLKIEKLSDSWKNSQELEKRCARYKWCWWWNKVVDEYVYYEKFIPAVQIKRFEH